MIEWYSAGRALEGQLESGDRSFVKERARGALFALIDGLGHGPAAAKASAAAVAALEDAAGKPLPVVMEEVHARLKSTRGAVGTAVAIDDGAQSLSYCGVGNVEGAIFYSGGRREAMVPRPGILGGEASRLQCRNLPLEPEALVVLATDGVRGGWSSNVQPSLPVRRVAEGILQTCARATDDALVLAVRWRVQR